MKEKINKIKWWLQRFGERDEDAFYFHAELNGKPLYIGLQYNFDNDGYQCEPMCFFKNNSKLNAGYIDEITEKELDDVIKFLFKK